MSLLLLPKKRVGRKEEKREEKKREVKKARPGLRRSRAGLENITGVIIAVIVMVLVIGLAVYFFLFASKTAGAMGTLTPSGAVLNPDNSITITVTAAGGDVNLQGIAVYSPSGVIATAGTTPVSASTSACSLEAIYTGGQTYSSLPVTIPTGQSATIVLSPGCQSGTSVTLYYNNGKSVSTAIS
jgi:type 1 fimbria pilin